MKTFTRMIVRYVLATAAVVLLVVGLLLGAVVYLGLHYGAAADSRVRIGTLAEALTPTADGLQLDPARTPADWLQGYAWAMALDDDGSVIWQHDLPQNLNKHYTASEIASFSRWYLDDWPVFCWTADYGLFVAAVPRGSVWKYNIYNNEQLMNAMAAGILPALALLLGVAAACCLLFSWRGARRLQTIAAGLDTVADGGTIRLPTDGFAGMTVRGDVLTDKENAGAALVDAFKEVKGLDPVPVGSYRGFQMSLILEDFGRDYVLTLKGQMTHRVTLGKDPRGNLTRIDNALNGMADRLATVQSKLESLYSQMETAKQELGKPFPQEDELRVKSARLAELNIALNIDDKTPLEAMAEETPPRAEIAKSARPSVLQKLHSYEKQSKSVTTEPKKSQEEVL